MDLSITDLLGAQPREFSKSISRRSSSHVSRKTSWETPIPLTSAQNGTTSQSRLDLFDHVSIDGKITDSGSSDGDERWNAMENVATLGLAFNAEGSDFRDTLNLGRFSLDDHTNDAHNTFKDSERPFDRWIQGIQRRASQRRKRSGVTKRSTMELERSESSNTHRRSGHKKSSSSSSFGFVTAVKSASTSLASFSIAPRSRRTGVSSRHQRADRSSKASNVGRLSEDSSYLARSMVIDQAVTNRLLQRRRVVEELINTEECYVADIKFLMNVYVTLLASIPSVSLSLRSSINRNLNEIIELHEELLGGLHRVVPHSEYSHIQESGESATSRGHQRWHSLDAVPENSGGISWLQKVPGLVAEPKVAAAVARVFTEKMSRFFIYEEYGAKYEMMIKDVASAYRTIPQWKEYQRGLEALASSLASINSQQDNLKKAMTVGDLLVKPIQRVCKYPLLFSELLKQTPVCDCPDSHAEIENALVRLREATNEINRATEDPRMKVTIEKSWLLQDRLIVPDIPDSRSRNIVRSLGHIHLCGVLYVSWQTQESVDGQYLVCLLYRDYLLLASASKTNQTYTVQACIALNEIGVEEADNGRGLQCHTASFSWKLVFESDHRLFEVTMSACSPKEELEWRNRLVGCSRRDTFDSGEQAVLASLSLRIKPLGTVFGKPGTIARKISIHRATTVGPNSGLYQVIIKNTNAFKESVSLAAINRSQSLLTTNRIPVLATSRSERIRLEGLLADVWTKDVLPFPGMTSRARSEQLVRASASSMMRKLSAVSIASNFTKRSGSMASLHRTAEDEEIPEPDDQRRVDQYLSERILSSENEDLTKSRLSVIQDEKENISRNDSFERLRTFISVTNGSPPGSLCLAVPLAVKKSWTIDGQRIITPPLRTSSANSIYLTRTSSLATITHPMILEDKENAPQFSGTQRPQPGIKLVKKSRVTGKGRSVVAEGLRNLFR